MMKVARVIVHSDTPSRSLTLNDSFYSSFHGLTSTYVGEGPTDPLSDLKEWANIARAAGKLPKRYGETSKGVVGFITEHVFVVEHKLHLGVHEPTDVVQRFVHTFRGSGIQYEEVVTDCDIEATIESDWDFPEADWASIWQHGERNGLGATRSQGYGRFVVTAWEPIVAVPKRQRRSRAA